MMFHVALLQISPEPNCEGNLAKGLAFCQRAKELGADIALFPEMWNIGYRFPGNTENLAEVNDWKAQAIDLDDIFFLKYQQLARSLDMAIGLTYLGKYDGGVRNTVSIIDRFGRVVLTYAKVHTCAFGAERLCDPGDDFYVCDLETKEGFVKVGAMICYDREFPESARILMLKGAEVVVIPNACEFEPHRTAQLQSRAYENMFGVALANYPGCKGRSMAFDGIAFDRREQSRDMLLVEAGPEEGIYMASFDLAELREYRKREVWGNAYRKPDRYGMLVSDEVKEPFVRGRG